ncbi:MAG: helix-turn-helix transcriptional regulator [bacterium]
MSKQINDFEESLKKYLKDPGFKKIWEDSEADYQIGKLLIEARMKQRISQRALAKSIGTTQAVLSRIESNTTSPTFRMAAKIARGLGKRLQVRFV